MGSCHSALILLHGLSLGWLRFYHQLGASPRLCSHDHGQIQSQTLHWLYNILLHRPAMRYADPVCRVSTHFNLRTHGSRWCFCLTSSLCISELSQEDDWYGKSAENLCRFSDNRCRYHRGGSCSFDHG